MLSPNKDVIIIGAGGAGMMCAIHAGIRGRSVLLLDHSQKLGGKILISGGGRCNFTNTGANPTHYVSKNPHFCKSALSRYSPQNFIEMVRKQGIPFHEKKLGQLFCDHSAQAIVEMLRAECIQAGAQFKLGCKITKITKTESLKARFKVECDLGVFDCHSLVIATGGLSLPKLGATRFGYEIAEQFGLKIIEPAPALDGFVLSDSEAFLELAGVSVDCTVHCNGMIFRENILFTHSGLSGPAALQASLHWRPQDSIVIDLLPKIQSFDWFLQKKKEGNCSQIKNLLSEHLPSRLADRLCELYFPAHLPSKLPLPQIADRDLKTFCEQLHHWKLTPKSTVGYSKAEVTRGGVDTNELSSKTMECKKVPGLYFIGEVVDVTGWLGGYNFQWAWASGWAAAQAV